MMAKHLEHKKILIEEAMGIENSTTTASSDGSSSNYSVSTGSGSSYPLE